MTPEERADQAKFLMEHPVLKKAFVDIRESLVTKLEGIPIGDLETQHETALMLQLLKSLRHQLDRYVMEGEVSKEKRRQETFMERIRQRVT